MCFIMCNMGRDDILTRIWNGFPKWSLITMVTIWNLNWLYWSHRYPLELTVGHHRIAAKWSPIPTHCAPSTSSPVLPWRMTKKESTRLASFSFTFPRGYSFYFNFFVRSLLYKRESLCNRAPQTEGGTTFSAGVRCLTPNNSQTNSNWVMRCSVSEGATCGRYYTRRVLVK